MKTSEPVIWAIDPFEIETRPDAQLVEKLISWIDASGFKLQPVTVAETYAERLGLGKSTEQYLQSLGIQRFKKPLVLMDETSSRRGAVQKMIRFANRTRSPWIIVSSRGKSGIERLVLGSFSENLLRHSEIPVLFLTHFKSPHKQDENSKTAVFSTDFSTSSKEAFKQFLVNAKRFKMEVVLFYSVSLPSIGASGMGIASSIPLTYFSEQLKWAKEESLYWINLARAQGVEVRFIVKDEGIAPCIGDSILKVADQESAALVVMASVSGPLATFAVGSVARDVFRANRYPVWIYGTQSLANKKEHESTIQLATESRV